MKFKLRTIKPIALCLLSSFVLATFIHSCGSKDDIEDEDVTPTPTPTPEPPIIPTQADQNPTPAPTTPPTAAPTAVAPKAKIYVGSAVQRFIAAYDIDGKLIKYFDLSPYFSAGGVTAMEFIDEDNLFVFFDPGAAGERIVHINVETGAINPAWGVDATNLNNVTVNSFYKDTNSRLYVQRTTSVINYIYNLSNSLLMPTATAGWPMTSTVSCPITAINGIVQATHNGSTYFLELSSGAQNRINTWSNPYSALACPAAGNSYNYTTTAPAAAGYSAISGIQLLDSKIYIRFAHATTPTIMRYDFNGTTISGGTAIFSDAGFLGSSVTIRGKMAMIDSTTFLLPNWDNDFIFKVTSTGEVGSGIFIKDGFTVDVGAIAVRP